MIQNRYFINILYKSGEKVLTSAELAHPLIDKHIANIQTILRESSDEEAVVRVMEYLRCRYLLIENYNDEIYNFRIVGGDL